jgi:hypothetical protein
VDALAALDAKRVTKEVIVRNAIDIEQKASLVSREVRNKMFLEPVECWKNPALAGQSAIGDKMESHE